MSLYSLFKSNGPGGFGHASTAWKVVEGISLAGHAILVTGCTSGIGRETARVLAARGAHVIGTARTEADARAACATFGVNAAGLACDLGEPASVRACVAAVARDHPPLDAIIGNAGIMALPSLSQAYGYERQFFTNHIGHFILITGLAHRLSDQSRVVMVSSAAHQSAPAEGIEFDNLSGERRYRPFTAYGQSKLANLLFARELARRLAAGQTANAVHPGVIVTTNIIRYVRAPRVFMQVAASVLTMLACKTIPQGAATQCFVAVHPGASGISGEYFVDCAVAKTSSAGADTGLARRLWEVSEQIVASV